MKGAYKKYSAQGLQVIGVGIQDTEANIRRFANELSMDWPVAHDKEATVTRLYGITFGAGAVFIGKDGIVKGRFLTGFEEDEFKKELAKII